MSGKKGISRLYEKAQLDDLFGQALACPQTDQGDRAFFEFQRKLMQACLPGFSMDFATASTIRLNDALEIVDLSLCRLDLPSSIEKSYLSVAEHDDVSIATFLNAGRAIPHTKFRSYEAWLNHPYFTNHCMVYDIYQSTQVSFAYPLHHRTYIGFEYLGSADNHKWALFDHTKLELASFPFALAWLYRKNIMDDTELARRFMAISDLTEHQLANLRKFINSPLEDYKSQASSLGIEASTLKESIYSVRDQVAPKFNWTPSKGRMPIRALDAEYQFLRMLGDHTRDINL